MTATPSRPPQRAQLTRRLQRAAAVAAAILAALALWAVATQAGGIDLRSPSFSATHAPAAVGAGTVVMAAGLAGLAAWAVLAILERAVRRPGRAWTTTALAALAVSLGAPLSGHEITGADRAVLVCLHLLVATTLIVLLGRTARHGPAAQARTTTTRRS